MSLRNEEARNCFESAIALEPGNINAWYCKALLLFTQKKIPEAKDCYEKILTLNPGPEYARALENLKKTIDLNTAEK
ncbi:MAG: tetratricopeptide repeat protein [Candidatus Helarchaeota archaeon]|nr:tetratricopeptide repeat protein [Candidatus Helarchaeota archaeon]